MISDTEEELELGTFCPQCLKPYNGLEVTMGRPARFKKYLVAILRCTNCGNLHGWLQEILDKVESS